MKTFRKVISEVAVALSPGDRAFVKMHVKQKHKPVHHPEHQFKGVLPKDHSKLAHPSPGTEAEVDAQKPTDDGESDDPDRLGQPAATIQHRLVSPRTKSLQQNAIHEAVGGIFSSNPIKKEKSVGEVRKLMRDPLKASEAHAKLTAHAFDGKLFDQIASFANMDASADVRPVVRKRMKELGIKGF